MPPLPLLAIGSGSSQRCSSPMTCGTPPQASLSATTAAARDRLASCARPRRLCTCTCTCYIHTCTCCCCCCCCACVDISRISLLMHTTSTQAVALDVVGRPALAALTMAVEAAAAPVAAAAATARRAAGPRRRVATTLLHPRRLIGRWLDASGASEALCGTTSPAGERECVAAASTPEYRHRRSRTDRVPRTASHPRGRTDTAYRARGADPFFRARTCVIQRPRARGMPLARLASSAARSHRFCSDCEACW